MFTKTLTTALITGLLLTGAMQSQSFANNGGGGDAPATLGWAKAYHKDGSSVTSRRNRDGSRTVTRRNARGCIIFCPRPPVAANPQPRPRGNRVNRPWASAYDPATGTRTTSIGNGDRTRTVITVSPFGFSIGLSR